MGGADSGPRGQPAKNVLTRDFLDRSGIRSFSSIQRSLATLEEAEKVELGAEGWQVSDPLFALWLASGEGE